MWAKKARVLTANDASALVGSVVALVASPDERARPNIGVADGAAAVTLLAESADGHARLCPTKDQVGVVLGHDGEGGVGVGLGAAGGVSCCANVVCFLFLLWAAACLLLERDAGCSPAAVVLGNAVRLRDKAH